VWEVVYVVSIRIDKYLELNLHRILHVVTDYDTPCILALVLLIIAGVPL